MPAARWALGAGTVAFAGALVIAQVAYAGPSPAGPAYHAMWPILRWAAVLAGVAVAAALAWVVAAAALAGSARAAVAWSC